MYTVRRKNPNVREKKPMVDETSKQHVQLECNFFIKTKNEKLWKTDEIVTERVMGVCDILDDV